MKSLKLKVSGMHCHGCVASVKEALLTTEGINKAEIDISNDTATVEFIENMVSIDRLVLAVENAGYKAKPLLN